MTAVMFLGNESPSHNSGSNPIFYICSCSGGCSGDKTTNCINLNVIFHFSFLMYVVCVCDVCILCHTSILYSFKK